MKEHLKILDFLRGFAALIVVLFHFGASVLPTIKSNYFSNIFVYGEYGVQVFFVISGFIIPYSMCKSSYKIKQYFRYLLKRVIRITPPYYISILLCFILYYSAVIIIGRPINGMNWPGVNLIAIIGNLTYTVTFLKTTWFNPVAWTLAIEFQFYILIGILLPLLLKKDKMLTFCCLVLLLMLNFIGVEWLFSVVSYFVLGILLFLNKEKLLSNTLLISLSIITVVCIYFQRGLVELIFGASTFLIILSGINIDWKISNFLGKISYSLYITHWTVGLMLEIVLKRIIDIHHYPIGKIIMLFVYTLISIVFATIFHKYIELPFVKYSKKIKLISKISK